MPRRKKSNLSSKSKNARRCKKNNESQSEENHNKSLLSNRVAKKKYEEKQSVEEKEVRLSKKRILNQLNNSEILKEHNAMIKSQKKSQVSMRTRNSIKRKADTTVSKSTKKKNLRQSIEEDMSNDDFDFSDIENQQPDEVHDKPNLEENNLEISDDFDFSDIETQQPNVSTQLYTCVLAFSPKQFCQ